MNNKEFERLVAVVKHCKSELVSPAECFRRCAVAVPDVTAGELRDVLRVVTAEHYVPHNTFDAG